MLIVDIFVCILLLGVPLYLWCHKLAERRQSDTYSLVQCFLSDKTKCVWHCLCGIFFAITYLAFRYLGDDWQYFSPLHIYGLAASFVMPFALWHLCKDSPKLARAIAIFMCCAVLLSPLTRPIVWIFRYKGVDNVTVANWAMAIPFNLSNIFALLALVTLLTKNKMLIRFVVPIGLLGGILNNVQIHNTHLSGFWHYLTWESYFVHALMIVIPIFVSLTKQLELDRRATLKNLIWFVPWFLLTGIVLNPLWNTNFNFTYPISIMSWVPHLSQPIEIFGGQFDPLYMSLVLVALCVFSFLFYCLAKFIFNRVDRRR